MCCCYSSWAACPSPTISGLSSAQSGSSSSFLFIRCGGKFASTLGREGWKKKTCRGYKDLVSLSRRRRSSRPGIPKNGVKIKGGKENKRKKDFPNSPWKTAGPWHNTKTSVFQHCRLSLVVTIPYIYPTYTHIHENPFTVSLSLSDCACVFSSKNLRPPSLTMTPAILRPLFF